MPYKTILFDLDGTLLNSSAGIIRSLQYAFQLYQIDDSEYQYDAVIGLSLSNMLLKLDAARFHDENLRKKVMIDFRDHYRAVGLFESSLYDGIQNMLDKIKKQQARLAIATLKPTLFAKQVLSFHGIDHYFDVIEGAEMSPVSSTKENIIATALWQLKNVDKSTTVMVGDHCQDIIGAHNNSIDSIAVGYGYGQLNEINQAIPTHLVHDVSALTHLLAITPE